MQTERGFAWKPRKAQRKQTLKGEEISGQHRILSGIFLNVFASALTAKVRAPLRLWIVQCGHEFSAGKRETNKLRASGSRGIFDADCRWRR